jgi:predicted TIM-barrel fold metal-dependent hydrolase
MKLSAPYRCSANVLSTIPPAEWLQAFLQAAPDRCVWGSDWPHTPRHKQGEANQPYRNIAYGRLFGDFLGALASPEIARRILIDNPVKLFGFSQSQPYTSVVREDGAR